MTAVDLYSLVMDHNHCVHCATQEEVQSVLRILDSHGASLDGVISRIMNGFEPEEQWKDYLIVGKSEFGNRGITLYSRENRRPAIVYDEIASLIDGCGVSAWAVKADFAALLV